MPNPDLSEAAYLSTSRWERIYRQVPLSDVPRHFAEAVRSPYLLDYLITVLKLCPSGSRTLETGIGTGYSSAWLSLRGVRAEGIDSSPTIVERAKQVNNILGGSASFRDGDLFNLYVDDAPRYRVIHHQGVLEHFTVPEILAALARQVALSDRVVFSVPSVYYPFEPEMGDERLLPLEEWKRILSPFEVEELRYYGDPRLGAKEHLLCVLRGHKADKRLRSLMIVPDEPYPAGISAIVHTRNEAARIEECLKSLEGWTDEVIVCDMESEDDTVEIASRFTDNIVRHPLISDFDRARNASAMRAQYRFVFYLDADERAPAGLGPVLRNLIETKGDTFEAVLLPFRHHFAGRFMQSLYPGYTAPRLLKNGKFHFNPGLHSGVQVKGRTVCFPPDNPDLALVHYSFDSLSHYLDKLNRYTDGEAEAMQREGQSFHWKSAVRSFIEEFKAYYDRNRAARDGVHGFIYSFLSAFYRFEQHAKLWERRFRAGGLQPVEMTLPADVEEVLEYMLSVSRERPLPAPPEISVAEGGTEVIWSGPLYDPCGYGEESRNLLFALDEAGVKAAAQSIPWSYDTADLSDREMRRLKEMSERAAGPGFVQIIENFAPAFTRHPQAGIVVGRTMFETDRLPPEWVKACNRMDYIWVPSEFNRRTFAQSGVDEKKLVVVPGCFDPAPYREKFESASIIKDMTAEGRFVFLSVFDWTLHKGWGVLLKAFLKAFEDKEDVGLILKVWSTLGYGIEGIRRQAAEFVKRELGIDLLSDRRVRIIQEHLTREELIALYQSCNAFVLPSRGEGWGRPYMEAMAVGLPVIGTDWSGNTAFMTGGNSYLIECETKPVSEAGWREIPAYKGHRWAEPSVRHTQELMRRVYEERSEAKEIGGRAKEEITARFNRAAVGRLMQEEIERIREERQPHPVLVCNEGETHTVRRPASERLCCRWEGAQFVRHSLAHVNREFCLNLIQSDEMELSLIPTEPLHFSADEDPRFKALADRFFAPLSRPADVHVRHHFPPRFDPPDEGRFVLIQPWEYGFLPEQWVEAIKKSVDEVWCYSNYVRETYIQSGIPAEKVKMVPLGVDTGVFKPEALPYVFTEEYGAGRLRKGKDDRFLFLFVGGTLHRKGIDILLEAYLRAFSAYDEVGLVIKDTGADTVYRGQNERERILTLAADATRPLIVYLDFDLPAYQMAGIYTACDCLVQPYRGEGFCLPALESMACGLPVIVPEGGPTDDFVDEATGWRMPAERRLFGNGRIGEWDCVGPTWMLEVSVDDLAQKMREVFHHREKVKEKGGAGSKRVKEGWTWRHSVEIAVGRLKSLKEIPLPPHIGDLTAAIPVPVENGFKIVDRRYGGSAPPLTRPMPKISLCMIVRNEERVLADCLKSVKPFVDEIIVTDTGSTDGTVKIADGFGARVFHFCWCDDFSAARNDSLNHAAGDWIFWMDADDTLPKECGEKLHNQAFLAEDRIAGYMMQVHFPPPPGEFGFTVVDHIKLFRNRPELRFEGRIHEQILEAINKSGGIIERSGLFVVHSGYDHSPEGQRRKRERDLKLLELDLKERPDHPFVWFNIGMTAFHLRDFDRAVFALQKCLSLSKPRESTVRKVYAMLAGSYLETGDPVRAKEWLEKGLALFPHDPELLFRAGIIYRELNDLTRAERSYVTLLTAREAGHIDSLDVSMTGFKAHHNLALIYQDMRRWTEAEREMRAAVSDNPRFTPSWLGLAELYIRLGRFSDASEIVTGLREFDPAQAEDLNRRLSALKG